MNFQTLKPSDFSLQTEQFFYFFNERSDPSEGEKINRHKYTSRCNVLNQNVKLSFIVDNPSESLESYIDKIKANIACAENNKDLIYSTMVAKRADDLFETKPTRTLSNQQFISFLNLEQVLMAHHFSG